MNSRIHYWATTVFFVLNAAVWVPWGIICLFKPEAWSGALIPGMNVFDLSNHVAQTEVRAMYGGLQIAIGLLAIIAIFKPSHRDTALLTWVLALTGLSFARIFGIIQSGGEQIFIFGTDVTTDTYNQIALSMYEIPQMIFAWVLYVTSFTVRTN